MNRVNSLLDHYHTTDYVTKELLAETDDVELQNIVKTAAEELNSPMALVSLLLDHIQFFKAHVGLPKVLAESRGTHRDVSFCQFVVRDGVTFEVTDGSNDPRIPKHVVEEFNIQSYLGMPIKVNEQVVGSLCVLDTKKRQFSTDQHESLKRLSLLVNERLEELTRKRRAMRVDLAQRTLNPAIAEVTDSLSEILNRINESYKHMASIRSFLKTWEISGKEDRSSSIDNLDLSFEAAMNSQKEFEDILLEMEMNTLNSLEGMNALDRLNTLGEGIDLSEIISSAQDLTRTATKAIGGFPLPDLGKSHAILVRSDFAIALIANALLLMSTELENKNVKGGIRLRIEKPKDEMIGLHFSAKNLDAASIKLISEQLMQIISEQHPTANISALDETLKIDLKTDSHPK